MKASVIFACVCITLLVLLACVVEFKHVVADESSPMTYLPVQSTVGNNVQDIKVWSIVSNTRELIDRDDINVSNVTPVIIYASELSTWTNIELDSVLWVNGHGYNLIDSGITTGSAVQSMSSMYSENVVITYTYNYESGYCQYRIYQK
jgi:hypothetical protein